ncbi:MAG: hypothetical protein HY815_01530 [Candidatus Riflebacteria bacterium]|nr:hypothetical protein [Candidatus Riflebacteria bacterium]
MIWPIRWCALILLAAPTAPWAATPAPGPMPPPDMSQVTHPVEWCLNQIQQKEDLQILDGVRPGGQLVVPGPEGRSALAFSRESAEGTRWPIMVLKGEAVRPELEGFYDLFPAYRVARLVWSKDGRFLVVHTQTESLDAPGGKLAVILTPTHQVKLIDRDVTRFVMSEDAVQLIYERAKQPGDLMGPRVLVHSDGNSGQRRVLHEVAYPKVQVSELGPYTERSVEVPVILRDYSAGIVKFTEIKGTLDLAKGQLRSASPAPSPSPRR